MAKVDLKAFTAELANELGATVDASVGDWNGVMDTADDVANARCDVKKTGSHKVQYTWHA